jgi:hypothetical protein
MKKTGYQIFIAVGIAALILGAFFWQQVLAGDQSKSNEFFVGTSPSQVSSSTDFPFSLYIGDDLTGVSNPVKNASFLVSGVYTGGGSLSLTIDGDATSTKVFTLPSVSGPTDFQLVYPDAFGKLQHASAGTYSHTVNVLPSGITISGLGIKLQTTHQFAQGSCVDGQSINQKVKTSEFFVASSPASLNSSLSMPFAIYIGDDISEITNAVKSFYFVVSGVYTGGGNLNLLLSADGTGTSTSFALVNSGSPKNFSFVFEDKDRIVNPASSGTYNYRLDMNLSGLTVSNLAVKAVMSHRYKPAGCGVGYPPFGDLNSAVFDSTASADGAAYNSILWKGKLGGTSFDQGKVKFQIAAADNSAGPWTFIGGTTCGTGDWYEAAPDTAVPLSCFSQINNKRYFRYKIRICSTDCLVGGTDTPQVDDVIVNWSP